MADKIPEPSDIDTANIKRPTVQQLSAEHQKALDDIQKKIRGEKEKEIQRPEEEVMKQYMLHFSIDGQRKVTKLKDVTFDSSQFEIKFDKDKHHVLNLEIANAIGNVVASHVNNKLDFVGQNIHSMFNDRFSQTEAHLGIKSIGNDKHASTSNTDKTMGGSASERIPTTNAMVTNSANQHSRMNEPVPHHTTLYGSTPNAKTPYGPASSWRHVPTSPNYAQLYGAPTVNRPRAEDFGSGSIKDELIKIFKQTFCIDPKGK